MICSVRQCVLQDGRRTCQTIPCPEVRACTDDDPYEDVTICCPKCSRIPSELQAQDVRDGKLYTTS